MSGLWHVHARARRVCVQTAETEKEKMLPLLHSYTYAALRLRSKLDIVDESCFASKSNFPPVMNWKVFPRQTWQVQWALWKALRPIYHLRTGGGGGRRGTQKYRQRANNGEKRGNGPPSGMYSYDGVRWNPNDHSQFPSCINSRYHPKLDFGRGTR